MSGGIQNYTSNRLRSSNITVVISITLVLFLIGLFGIIIMNAHKYSDFIKERLVMELYLKDTKLEQESHLKLLDSIKNLPYIHNAKYIDKATASAIAKKDLGVDAHALFEEDIFPASIEIALKSEYVTPEKINQIKNQLSKISSIDDVRNDNELMVEVYQNINKISLWIIGFSILFTIIAIILINNSIKLKIYSKRFIIKTMQLVGAKRRFILMPFVKEALKLGIIGSILASAILFSLWYYFSLKINQPIDWVSLWPIAASIFGVGIIITVGSTWFATWKFLNLRRDDLFYN